MNALYAREIVLLRGRWVLARAGFEEAPRSSSSADTGTATTNHCMPPRWVSRHEPLPLPCRQELEERHPEALLPPEEFERIHASLVRAKAADGTDSPDALPLVAVSHCWEGAEEPDSSARVVRAIADALGGRWSPHGMPSAGLPLYRAWGFEEVGLFYDWSSLYQHRTGVPRTPPQQACFEAALHNMSMWFAHQLTTVLVVRGQDPYLQVPRSRRGWPVYEEAMACLLKPSPPSNRFHVGGTLFVRAWAKLLEAGGDRAARVQQPPRSPNRFEDKMRTCTFTDGADRQVVCQLYRTTLEDGFGGLTTLRYASLGWSSADVSELYATLRAVRCPEVTSLSLSGNKWVDRSADGSERRLEALEGVLHMLQPSLESLSLARCDGVVSLGEQIGQLAALTSLDVAGCTSLAELPRSLTELKSLRTLDLSSCTALTSLPEAVCELSALRTLRLFNCTQLATLPAHIDRLPMLETLDLTGCTALGATRALRIRARFGMRKLWRSTLRRGATAGSRLGGGGGASLAHTEERPPALDA